MLMTTVHPQASSERSIKQQLFHLRFQLQFITPRNVISGYYDLHTPCAVHTLRNNRNGLFTNLSVVEPYNYTARHVDRIHDQRRASIRDNLFNHSQKSPSKFNFVTFSNVSFHFQFNWGLIFSLSFFNSPTLTRQPAIPSVILPERDTYTVNRLNKSKLRMNVFFLCRATLLNVITLVST